MSLLISVRDIKKSYGDKTILNDINMDIRSGEKLGLVGRNGAGKTSLANIIYGSLEYDAGKIICHKNDLIMAYLSQVNGPPQKAGYDSDDEQPQSGSMKSGLLHDKTDCDEVQNSHEFMRVSSYLGLSQHQVWDEEHLNGLSGGEKTKLALAAIWAKQPGLLILDEPTNHLDMQGVEWLIGELRNFAGAVIIISHDRYFLDQTVNRIVELDNGVVNDYWGNYSFYRAEKQRRYESQLHQYNAQVKEQERIEQNIMQLKDWSSQAHRESRRKAAANGAKKEYYRAKAKKRDKAIKSKIKQLEKMKTEGPERPQAELTVKFDYSESGKRGRRVIEAVNISKSYGARTLFHASSFYIKKGEKVGVYGHNGCGKTTLLKIILGLESLDQGELFISSSARIAYIGQDSTDLDPDNNALQIIDAQAGIQRSRATALLANMGINEAMLKRKVKNLSPGEQTRIKIARSIMSEPQLLILDEPGNHLDLPSREQLESTLLEYDGTVLLVSHDRYMLEKLCDVMLIFDDTRIQRIDGGVKEYFARFQTGDKRKPDRSEADRQEEKLIIETRISYLLGELNRYQVGSEEYCLVDTELMELMKRKRSIERK